MREHKAASYAGASAVVHVDRRTLLVAGTSALVPAAAPRFANAAIDPAVLEKAEKVKAAIKFLAPNSGSAVEDMVVGVVDDGSESMLAAFLGAAAAGGKAVKLKGSLEDMQAQYRDAGCIVAVTMNAAAIKKVMSGEGLSCVQCGSDGGAAPPKFFLVMDSQGKSNKELQELGEVTGRVESFSQPGTFMELGAFGGGAPVFSLENLK